MGSSSAITRLNSHGLRSIGFSREVRCSSCWASPMRISSGPRMYQGRQISESAPLPMQWRRTLSHGPRCLLPYPLMLAPGARSIQYGCQVRCLVGSRKSFDRPPADAPDRIIQGCSKFAHRHVAEIYVFSKRMSCIEANERVLVAKGSGQSANRVRHQVTTPTESSDCRNANGWIGIMDIRRDDCHTLIRRSLYR